MTSTKGGTEPATGTGTGDTDQATPPSVHANAAIVWMLLAVFGVGTVEYVVAGVLKDITGDVGVSDATGGLLITVYALTVMIGGPLLTIVTIRIPRNTLIAALMAVFVVGNIGTALAPNFPVLIFFRVVTALPHATFFALCLVLATSLVPPEFQGRVIARVTLGLNLATVLGVPLGTLIGTQLGWRWSFVIVAVFQVVVTAGLLSSTRHAPSHEVGSIVSELRVFTRPTVVWAIGLTALSQAALFVVFTFVSPFLQDLSGFTAGQVTVLLFVFGIGSVLGNQLGGYFADKSIDRTLYVALTALVVALALLALFGTQKWFVAPWMFVLGAAGFSIIPPLASKIIGAASEAPHLAATVNIAGFQLANAAGAWIGSLTLSGGAGLSALPVVGAVLGVAALGVLTLSTLTRRSVPAGVTADG
ncbi:MFS transporter [Rhodococcus triatomae]|uniref:MFS transporter, DHA1 family, inner membrane transport protein n=1 Tax=Rhodococcus triatomae TaxID=300028 RepID=A0A1G8G9S1_9NOCA|nr:MFS transporter [Rhodococcus triatomae]QNG20446.1 MFS transporter [Rhodococcus triatomae]QNG23638.1 MFS transporter [Rhodococcus triatomae]SDH91103.1 MFS transporter, DHA1 family, inner membrane transport protein [Rhodococcus triatomae]